MAIGKLTSLVVVNLLMTLQSGLGFAEANGTVHGYRLRAGFHRYENPGGRTSDPKYFALAVKIGEIWSVDVVREAESNGTNNTIFDETFFEQQNRSFDKAFNLTRNSAVRLSLGPTNYKSGLIPLGDEFLKVSLQKLGVKQIFTTLNRTAGILLQVWLTVECLPGTCGPLCQWPVGNQTCDGNMITCTEKSLSQGCQVLRGNFAYRLKIQTIHSSFYRQFDFKVSGKFGRWLSVEVCIRRASENCSASWWKPLLHSGVPELYERNLYSGNNEVYDYYREVDKIEFTNVISLRFSEFGRISRIIREFDIEVRSEEGILEKATKIVHRKSMHLLADFIVGCRDGYQGSYCSEACSNCRNYDPLSLRCYQGGHRGPQCAYDEFCDYERCPEGKRCSLISRGEGYERHCD